MGLAMRNTYFEQLLPVKSVKNMLPPSTPAAPATTYTTIPISGTNIISRSFQNLSSFLSRHRPWPEHVSAGSIDVLDSLSGAGIQLRRNAKYFGINYFIVTSICATFSLVSVPIALIVYAMWLVLYFFREDPMLVWGRHVDDRLVIVRLVVVSSVAVWLTGKVYALLIGIAVEVLISTVHGVLRNLKGLFLDEDYAISNDWIGPPPLASTSHLKDFSN